MNAEVRALRDHLVSELIKQQALRRHYEGTTWQAAEASLIYRLCNEYRAKRGFLTKVSIEQIARCDLLAAGQVDYTSKFCLYAAELAVQT